MKNKHKIIIGFLSIGVVGCWAVLAFCIREELVSRFSLWSSMIVGTAAVIISFIALYISFLSFKKENTKANNSIENRTETMDNSDK